MEEHLPRDLEGYPTIAQQVAALNSRSRRSCVAREVGRAITFSYWTDGLVLKLWEEDVAGEKLLKCSLQAPPADPLPGDLDYSVRLTAVWSGMAAKVLIEFDDYTINRFATIEAVDLKGPDFTDEHRALLATTMEGYWPISSAFHETHYDRDDLVRLTDELVAKLEADGKAEVTYAESEWTVVTQPAEPVAPETAPAPAVT